jgi:DNA repair exonuclease SbcCD ATPase subunit
MTATLRILRMRFSNFGPFVHVHEFEWDRGPGLWFIGGRNLKEPELGANGAGKTSLVTALYWGLTGRTLRSNRPGDRIEPWDYSEDGTFVEIDFARHDGEHKILRRRNPNRLLLDKEPTTDEEIQKLFGVAPEVMLYTFIFGQHHELFMDLKPEPQAQLFTDLLELDQWIEAAERAGKEAKTAAGNIELFERELGRLDGRLAGINEQLLTGRNASQEWEASTAKELQEARKLVAALEPQLAAANKRYDALDKPINLTKALADERDAERSLDQWLSRRDRYEREANSKNDAIKDIEQALRNLSDTGLCQACGQKLPAKENAAAKKRYKDQIASLTALKETALAEVAESKSEVAAWRQEVEVKKTAVQLDREANEANAPKRDAVIQECAVLKDRTDRAKRDVERCENAVNPYEAQLKEAAARQEQFEKDLKTTKTHINALKTEHETANYWQDAYRTIRLSIVEATLTEVSAAANRHAEQLGLYGWGITFSTERETKRGSVSLGFNTALYPPGQTQPVPFDSYSGGESTRWQFAVSFGLGEVLLSRAGVIPNIELLDEPTRGLSPEGISDLLQCLNERAKETGRTIYLIDHHSIDRGSFDGIITVEKAAGGSRIKE